MTRWIVIGIGIAVALMGEQLAACFLWLGYEVGSARFAPNVMEGK